MRILKKIATATDINWVCLRGRSCDLYSVDMLKMP